MDATPRLSVTATLLALLVIHLAGCGKASPPTPPAAPSPAKPVSTSEPAAAPSASVVVPDPPGTPAVAPAAPPPPAAHTDLATARQTGWNMAKIVVETLEESDQADLPGIEAWLADCRAAAKDFENPPKPGQLPPLDVETLVTYNPNFWLAHYEVAPGDIGLNCLHAGLLLAAGEARRAQCLLAIAEQRPGIPAEFGKNIGILIAHCDQAGEASNAVVAESIKLHDAGDYAATVTKLNEALALWPQNGFAHYELGLTLYQQQRKAAGAAALANTETKIQINSDLPQSPEVQAEYALARRHDPFQFRAWQGTDQNVIQGLMVLLEKGMPAWEKLMETRPRPVSDETLEQLAAALQESGTHDLALVTRQVLIARRGRYDRPDHPFISTSLKKLAPGDEIDALLDRLWSGPLKARQLVVPE